MTPAEEFELFLDVPLDVDVELDRHTLTVRQILALEVGSVLRVKRSAGETLDVRVGGTLFGSGEIVAGEANTGIRLTDFCERE